jgi:uncharacterized protein YbjT (DUF2867 family)
MKKLLKILGGFIGVVVALVICLVLFVMVTLKPNLPEDTFALAEPESIGQYNVLVFGATGNLGVEIVQDLVSQGDKVTAFVRQSSDRSQLEPLGVDFAVGDVMELETVIAAFDSGEYDAAIMAIAGMSVENLDYLGNANVADAANTSGVKRIILISTVGAGDSYDSAPLISQLALANVLVQKTKAEDHIRASGLDYTILRPGGLPPGIVATGGGLVSEDVATMGFIKRPDLARVIVNILYDDATIGKTLAVVDPSLTRPWAGADPD